MERPPTLCYCVLQICLVLYDTQLFSSYIRCTVLTVYIASYYFFTYMPYLFYIDKSLTIQSWRLHLVVILSFVIRGGSKAI